VGGESTTCFGIFLAQPCPCPPVNPVLIIHQPYPTPHHTTPHHTTPHHTTPHHTTPHHPSTYYWHDHTVTKRPDGLQGMLIVREKGEPLGAAKNEAQLVLNDWWHFTFGGMALRLNRWGWASAPHGAARVRPRGRAARGKGGCVAPEAGNLALHRGLSRGVGRGEGGAWGRAGGPVAPGATSAGRQGLGNC
jgi:hypothetical protein